MSTPFESKTRYFEHSRYAEFLATFTEADHAKWAVSQAKQMVFTKWLRKKEAEEDIEDFKNLVPMHIRMNTEEWEWFKNMVDADEKTNLPNLKALVNHPPKAFKDLD